MSELAFGEEYVTLELEGRTVRLTPTERDEWARRAVKVFQGMEYSLTAFARVLTGDPGIRLVMTAGGPRTDGRTIYYRPPLYLGDPSPHRSSQCDRRDADGHLICPACMGRESVIQIITHEIAHIVGGSFSEANEYQKRQAIRRGVNAATDPAAVKALHNGLARVQYDHDVQQMLKSLSPFLFGILLSLEDARIDLKMFRARLGTEKMFRSMTKRVFARGYPDLDGSVTLWREKPLNAQMMIGCYCVAEGYDYTGWLHPQVERDLEDPVLADIMARVDRSGGVMDIASLSIETLVRLWQMGYCDPPQDMPPPPEPEPEPPAPEPEPEDQHEDESDSPPGEGEAGESGESGESSEGSPSSGGDSSSADGSPEEGQHSPESDSGDGGDTSGGSSAVGDLEQGDGDSDAEGEPSEGESVPDGSGDESSGERDGSQDSESGSGSDADREAGEQADSEGEDSTASGESGEQSGPGADGGGEDGLEPGSSEGGDAGDGDELQDTSEPASGDGDSDEQRGDDHAGDGPGDGSELQDNQPAEEGDPEGGADGAGSEDDRPSVDAESDGADSQPGGSADGDPGQPGGEDAFGDPGSGGPTGDAPENGADSSDSPAGGQDAPGSESANLPETSAHPESAAGNEGDGGAAQSVPAPDAPDVSPVGDEQHGDLERGLRPDPEPVPDHGSAEDVVELVQDFTGHNHDDDEELHLGMPSDDEETVNAAMDKAITQNKHFDMPTGKVLGVDTYTWPEDDGRCYAWLSNYEPQNLTLRIDDPEHRLELIRTPETILQPALFDMRRVFSDNRRGRREPNLKTGHVNGRVLGRRAWSGDERLFKKTSRPKSKSYAVVIGLDISGSTDGSELVVEKQAVFAQAELLHRMGIQFEIWAHSAKKAPGKCWGLQMYRIKAFNQPWNAKTQEGVTWLHSSHYNLDGHTVEFYRKRLTTSAATTKILLYFTDGAMPAANYDDEVEVLRQEVKNYKRLGITMLGVGIGTDSPKQWGMDTIRINNKGDIGLVVKHLEGILTMTGR